MNKHRKNDAFDDTLYRAFHDYYAEEKEDIPSDEELKRLFPLPEDYLQAVDDELRRSPADAFGGPDSAHSSFTDTQKAISYSMTSFFTTGGIRGGKNLGIIETGRSVGYFYLGIQHRLSAGGLRKGAARL